MRVHDTVTAQLGRLQLQVQIPSGGLEN